VDVESSAALIRTVRPLQGELPLQTFEAYRSVGSLVRRELDDAERMRLELLRSRTAPRGFPSAAAGRLLSVWNAYVLQTVGEHLLDAVEHRSFGTVRAGATARILAFLGPVDGWMSQARHAATDVSYQVGEHVRLPAEPPAWRDQTHGPYPLSTAMATALEVVHARGGSVLADYVRSPVMRAEDVTRLRWIRDRAAAAIAYSDIPGEDDWSWPASTALHLWYALRLLFLFGQAAAMPVLLDAKDPATVASLVAGVPSEIDVWSLTDPHQRGTWRSLPPARAAIQRLWAADPSPMATVRVQAQIDAALRTGAILFATDRTGVRLGSFYRCPWPAVYEVRRPVTIGGTRLLPMQHFTFDVLGEAYGERQAPYARRIVVSVFVPTDSRRQGRLAPA
jgi:hypothetical protein